jgi:prepilin-type N-terminal cleavage/methylation domain-containing protein
MRKISAFTLIEVMIALVIFSILASISVVVMYDLLNSRQAINEHSQRLHQRQLALNIIDNDLWQAVPRTIIAAENALMFRRLGYPNPQWQDAHGEVQIVRYRLHDKKLVRTSWLQGQREIKEQVILNELQSVTWKVEKEQQQHGLNITLTFPNGATMQRWINIGRKS